MNAKSSSGDLRISKFSQQAERTARDPKRLHKLLEDSKEKIGRLAQDDEKVKGFLGMLRTLIRMVKAYLKGEYKVIPWKTLLLMVGALIYFVSPLDLIPDFIPITGFIDDISLVVWIFTRIQNDIRDFEAWERTQPQGVARPNGESDIYHP